LLYLSLLPFLEKNLERVSNDRSIPYIVTCLYYKFHIIQHVYVRTRLSDYTIYVFRKTLINAFGKLIAVNVFFSGELYLRSNEARIIPLLQHPRDERVTGGGRT